MFVGNFGYLLISSQVSSKGVSDWGKGWVALLLKAKILGDNRIKKCNHHKEPKLIHLPQINHDCRCNLFDLEYYLPYQAK